MAGKLGRALRAVWAALLTVGVVGVLFVLAGSVVPGFLGYGAAIVRSGSMGDALPTGSVAFTRNVEVGEIAVGDIITFRHGSGAEPVTHRVVATALENGSRVLTTKGDANATDDVTPVVASSGTLPRVVASFPLAGYALDFARGPVGLFLFVILPVAGLLFDRKRSEGRRRKKASKATEAPEPAPLTSIPDTLPLFVDPVALELETPVAPISAGPAAIEAFVPAAPAAVPPPAAEPPPPEPVAFPVPVPLDLPAQAAVPLDPSVSFRAAVPGGLPEASPPLAEAGPVQLDLPVRAAAASSGLPQPASSPAPHPLPPDISIPGTSSPAASFPGTPVPGTPVPAPALPPVVQMPAVQMPAVRPPAPVAPPVVPATAPLAPPVSAAPAVEPSVPSLQPGDRWVTSLEPAAILPPFAPPAVATPAHETPEPAEPMPTSDPAVVVLDEPVPAMAGGVAEARKDPKRPADWTWEFDPEGGRRRGRRR